MYSFGWCKGIEDAGTLKRMGFDYIECALASLELENQVHFNERFPLYVNSPLPVLAFNIFFPGDMKVIGPEVDQERVRRYIHKAASALNKIGAKTAVLGSGRSRNVPDGWDRKAAEEQFVQLLGWIASELSGTGVALAIEPLNSKESNFVNRVSEAVMFAKQMNHPSIRVLADFYHMDEEKEPLHTLVQNKDWLAHIHLADSGRLSPGTGRYPYRDFAAALQASGYKGMISAECTVNNPETELPESLAYMKMTFS
ncbi:sugar phosphate isomerase/epimerase [Paenibacillus sp. N4]|uniref:sugar phosphate isomerase/epimerase family protein n=1 Tax=Paenibacillus vietnamensis TaxID=2590547 RepID=UPI001CD16721|nr:sugar phosphate isomerase/epimerase family protein [Paenibacillus vietnamensis]MCA0757224.1 sugar phosphate isomerase/epimerase [Paenibacillus vietnamensis]